MTGFKGAEFKNCFSRVQEVGVNAVEHVHVKREGNSADHRLCETFMTRTGKVEI